MAARFSPSINIIRDAEKAFNYIPTPNSQRIVQQIVNDYKIGIHSFNLIGSYGTGKSSFLLAFEKSLRGERQDFGAIREQFGHAADFEFLRIVGEYRSLFESLMQSPQLAQYTAHEQDVWKAIDRYYADVRQRNACLVIFIDEFGKFLEYAAAHTPERELYCIQQLAEYANDEEKNILFISTLHQGFDSYARDLNVAQRHEWEKVKGRLKELTFNEPVELLLNLAADHLDANRTSGKPQHEIRALVNVINASRTFPHRNTLTPELAQKLVPFDPLAGAVLTLALQRYGQNERSLFTFLQSNDRHGLFDYDADTHPYYNLACLHDYLLHNYHSFLSTKYNPHYTQWAAIRRALERVEGRFEQDVEEAASIVKTIGLLNIFASENAAIDKEFLLAYAEQCLGIQQAEPLIKQLENHKIILFRVFRNKFLLFEGTDLDFEMALLRAASNVDAVNDVVTPLKKHFDFPYILAKAVSYQRGTPRFFTFELSESPSGRPPHGEIDGVINLVFSETISVEAVQEFSTTHKQAILYGVYGNTRQIREMLFEIAKAEHVIKDHHDDHVAVQELRHLIQYQREELNRAVLEHVYDKNSDIVWVFQGRKIPINSLAEFNALLSSICENVYCDTPIFRNELVNRHMLSSAISTARKNFFSALLEHAAEEDLAFPTKNFPPEKTIYLSLLKDTGIHRCTEAGYTLSEPQEPSFHPLWQASSRFLEGAKAARRNLQEFIELLEAPPLKLKGGLIDFWMPTFLYITREEFAIYQESVYLPELNRNILEQIVKKPQRFQVKTFDVQGVKLDIFRRYRAMLQQTGDEGFTNASFIETVKPFLTFYRSLPQYTRHTKNLDPPSLRLREVIVNASDPEKTFFEDFPRALGYGGELNFNEIDDDLLKAYIHQLQTSIRNLRTCFSALIGRIEVRLRTELGCPEVEFPAYRALIRERFASLREHLLLEHLKGFYSRILSDFGDRDAWIGSIVHALLHKPLEEMQDEEEELIYQRLNETMQELDNLCDIAKLVIDPEREKVVKLEVTSSTEGSQERLVRLPKKKTDEAQHIEKSIDKKLAKLHDRSVRIAILVKLLQRELRDE